jgi:hypothetical protein
VQKNSGELEKRKAYKKRAYKGGRLKTMQEALQIKSLDKIHVDNDSKTS